MYSLYIQTTAISNLHTPQIIAVAILSLRVSPFHIHGTPDSGNEGKKRTQDNMFQEMLQGGVATRNKTKVWRMTFANSIQNARVERRKPRSPSRQRKNRCTRK